MDELIYDYSPDWCKVGDILTVRHDIGDRREYHYKINGCNYQDSIVRPDMTVLAGQKVEVIHLTTSERKARIDKSDWNFTPNMFEEFKYGMPVSIDIMALNELYKD